MNRAIIQQRDACSRRVVPRDFDQQMRRCADRTETSARLISAQNAYRSGETDQGLRSADSENGPSCFRPDSLAADTDKPAGLRPDCAAGADREAPSRIVQAGRRYRGACAGSQFWMPSQQLGQAARLCRYVAARHDQLPGMCLTSAVVDEFDGQPVDGRCPDASAARPEREIFRRRTSRLQRMSASNGLIVTASRLAEHADQQATSPDPEPRGRRLPYRRSRRYCRETRTKRARTATHTKLRRPACHAPRISVALPLVFRAGEHHALCSFAAFFNVQLRVRSRDNIFGSQYVNTSGKD